MDLSSLKFEPAPQERRRSESKEGNDHEEIPWRSPEEDAFRNFLVNVKKRQNGYKEAGKEMKLKMNIEWKNLCIIRGQTGSGKVSTIRRMCKTLKIKLVEYDPFNIEAKGVQEFDHNIDHLIRFLQNSLSRKSLKTKNVKDVGNSNNNNNKRENIILGTRKVKRIKNLNKEGNKSDKDKDKSITSDGEEEEVEESEIVMIGDLPRGIFNCKYGNLYPLQNLIKEVMNSEMMNPLIIVTTNSSDDYLMLRRILPNNFAKDPRCLIINLKEITKTKIMTYLKLNKKNKLVEHIVEVSSGDIRYITNNISFYNNLKVDGDETEEGKEDVKSYILERNNVNNFSLLGKILFNKRVPVYITKESESENENDNIKGNGSESHDSEGSKGNLGSADMNTNKENKVYPEKNLKETLLSLRECFEKCKPVENKIISGKLKLKDEQREGKSQEIITRSQEWINKQIDKMPIKVKILGLTEEFDEKRPLTYTKWPKIRKQNSEESFRLSASKLMPKLTRPLVYYNPEELVESIKSEANFFANCIFDNYADLFGHIDDCANFTRHCTAADRYYSANWNMQEFESAKTFLSICVRAAADSNIHGFESQRKGFHHFVTNSSIKTKSDHMKVLFQDFMVEKSKNDQVKLYSREVIFQEIIPIMSMLTGQNEEEECRRSSNQDEVDEYNILDVLDEVDKILEKGTAESVKKEKKVEEDNIFTPKFNEMVQEISTYYNRHTKGPYERLLSD